MSTGVETGSKFHVLVLEGAQEGCGKGEQEESPAPRALLPPKVSKPGLPALGWGTCGDPSPAVPRLLLPEPFSSACAMGVVTELGPTQRGPFPVRGGETQTNIAEVKVSFLIPRPGFSFFPAFPPPPPGPSLCSHPPSVSLSPFCHKKVTVSSRGQFSYAILYTVLHV